jgi:nucleoside-diphosphate-sugar epimerase
MDLRGATIAVTGATGFLGRYIVRSLLGRGARVVGVVRNPDKGRDLAAAGVELRSADLGRRQDLARAFAGVDAVVANAAVVALGHVPPAQVLRTNVEGTRNVFEAMGEAGVRRAVYVSSGVVYRRRRGEVPDESHPLRATDVRVNRFNVYGVSKTRAESEARAICGRLGIALTIVRPNGIYGAFDYGGFTYWFRRLVSLPLAPYPAGMRLDLVYAGDVAEAIAACLERPIAAERAYNLAGEGGSAWDFARAWAEAGGRRARLLIPIPVPLFQRFDCRRAREDLDWRRRSYVEGIRDMLRLEAEAEAPQLPVPDARGNRSARSTP